MSTPDMSGTNDETEQTGSSGEAEQGSTPSETNGIDRRKFLFAAGAGLAGFAGATLGGAKLFSGPGEPDSPGSDTNTGSATSSQSIEAVEVEGSRSLVCIFLEGGADSANIFIPIENSEQGKSHDAYRKARGNLAIPGSDLLGFDDGKFGFNPGVAGLANLANEGRLAVVQNVGPLARPMTKADFLAKKFIPQSLFAHDAQQKLWQTARPDLTSSQGWGGLVSSAVSRGAEITPAFSLNGSNIWQSAVEGPYTRLSPTVPIQRMLGYDATLRASDPRTASIANVLARSVELAGSSSNVFEREVADLISGSIVTTERLQEATAPDNTEDLMTDIDGNRLGMQLRLVARLIKNREDLGMARQMFFVRMSGWDTHGQQAERFPVLLAELDAAVTLFQRAIDELGVADTVTTFTASDFGRTLTLNGDGTDHGWGGHSFVFGSSVKGGLYGTFPSYATNNNPDDTGETGESFAGRLIPTTAVCQYGATMARWMGLQDSHLDAAFPELQNFEQRDVGFLKRA